MGSGQARRGGNECRARSAGCRRANPGSGLLERVPMEPAAVVSRSRPRGFCLLRWLRMTGWNQRARNFQGGAAPGTPSIPSARPNPDSRCAEEEATIRTKRIKRTDRMESVDTGLLLLDLRGTPEHSMITSSSHRSSIKAAVIKCKLKPRHDPRTCAAVRAASVSRALCERVHLRLQGNGNVGSISGVHLWPGAGVARCWRLPALPQPAKQSPQNGRSEELPSRRVRHGPGAGMGSAGPGRAQVSSPFCVIPIPSFWPPPDRGSALDGPSRAANGDSPNLSVSLGRRALPVCGFLSSPVGFHAAPDRESRGQRAMGHHPSPITHGGSMMSSFCTCSPFGLAVSSIWSSWRHPPKASA